MQRIAPNWIISLLFLITVIIAMSCSKDKLQNLLIGKWNRIDVINIDSATSEQWEFQSDGTFWMHDAQTGYGDTLNEKGSFAVASSSEFEISLSDSSKLIYLQGVWTVVKKKNGYLMLVFDLSQFEGRGRGLVFREFQRQK